MGCFFCALLATLSVNLFDISGEEVCCDEEDLRESTDMSELDERDDSEECPTVKDFAKALNIVRSFVQ